MNRRVLFPLLALLVLCAPVVWAEAETPPAGSPASLALPGLAPEFDFLQTVSCCTAEEVNACREAVTPDSGCYIVNFMCINWNQCFCNVFCY